MEDSTISDQEVMQAAKEDVLNINIIQRQSNRQSQHRRAGTTHSIEVQVESPLV